MNNTDVSNPSKITRPAVIILIVCSLKGSRCGNAEWRGSAFAVGNALLFDCKSEDIRCRTLTQSNPCLWGAVRRSYREQEGGCKCWERKPNPNLPESDGRSGLSFVTCHLSLVICYPPLAVAIALDYVPPMTNGKLKRSKITALSQAARLARSWEESGEGQDH